MKILYLTTHADVGGITSYSLMVSGGLRARGHQTWVASGGGALVGMFEGAGVTHLRVSLRTKSELDPRLWFAYRWLLRFLRRERVDVLHAQTRVAQVVGTWLSRRTGIPLVTTWHGFFRPHWGRRMFRCMGERVIAISPAVARHLEEAFHVPRQQIALIEHGIPIERFQAPSPEARRTLRQEFGLPTDAFVVGTVARLVPDKGIDRLVAAVARVAQRHPRVRLVIVGSGPEEARLRALVQRLALTERVLFLGTQEDLTAPLSAMDAFVFPVVGREGFGLVMLEAMAMELPVIATTQPALVHVLDEGRAGLLVPPGDVERLAAAITQLIEQPAFAEQLALRGFARAREMFTLDRMLDRLEAVYTDVMRSHHATPVGRRP